MFRIVFFHLVIFLALVLMLTRVNCVSSLILELRRTTGQDLGTSQLSSEMWDWKVESGTLSANQSCQLSNPQISHSKLKVRTATINNCWSLKLKSDCKLVLPRSLFPTFIEAIKHGKYFDLPFSKLNAKFNLQWRKNNNFFSQMTSISLPKGFKWYDKAGIILDHWYMATTTVKVMNL